MLFLSSKSTGTGMVSAPRMPPRIAVRSGRNVDGALVNSLCERLGIEKLRSSPYHLQGNGQAERSVETFKQAMRCLLEERHFNETDWPTLVQEVTYTCNSYFNASTGCSPHEVMYGSPLRSMSFLRSVDLATFPVFKVIVSIPKRQDMRLRKECTRTSRALSRLWRGSIIVELSTAKLNQDSGSGSEMMRPHSLSQMLRGT